MIYSGNTPCEVSEKCYKDIEKSLECFYNSENNPFRHLFENSRRVTQKYVANKFNLVIMDFGDDPEDEFIQVNLQSIENEDYKPFNKIFHKQYGEIE